MDGRSIEEVMVGKWMRVTREEAESFRTARAELASRALKALLADWEEALLEDERGCPLNVCDVCGGNLTIAGDCATSECPRFDSAWLENARAVRS